MIHNWYQSKGFSTGPLDFPMRSESAKELETLIKEAEKEGLGYQRQWISSEIKSQDSEGLKHTALLQASTDDVDRDGEVILQKGISLKLFKKNPVICWAHDSQSRPPIGRSVWEKFDPHLKSLVQFADRPEDYPEMVEWFPDTIYHLCKQGILKGVSIGFLPLEGSAPTVKEIELRPELASCRRVIRKSMLCEISIVPIGCNPSCLIEGVSKGLIKPEVADLLGVKLLTTEDESSLWKWDASDFPVPEVKAPTVEEKRHQFLKSLLNKK